MTHEDVKPKLAESLYTNGTIPWLGSVEPQTAALWADLAIAMVSISISWHLSFQDNAKIWLFFKSEFIKFMIYISEVTDSWSDFKILLKVTSSWSRLYTYCTVMSGIKITNQSLGNVCKWIK